MGLKAPETFFVELGAYQEDYGDALFVRTAGGVA